MIRLLFKKVNMRKGAADSIAFFIVAPLICFLIIEVTAYVQLSSNIHEITGALDVAGRGAVVCTNFDDAEDLCQMMAESSIISTKIHNIETTIDYATADREWKRGLLIKVTLTADIDTVSFLHNPFSIRDHSVSIEKSMIYTVEGSDNALFLSEADRDTLARVISGEGGNGTSAYIAPQFSASYSEPTGYPGTLDMVYVGSVVINRMNSSYFPNTIGTVVYQPGQYACVGTHNFNNPSPTAYAVADYLIANGSQLPPFVLYQSAFSQGGGVFCRVQNPGMYTHIYSYQF